MPARGTHARNRKCYSIVVPSDEGFASDLSEWLARRFVAVAGAHSVLPSRTSTRLFETRGDRRGGASLDNVDILYSLQANALPTRNVTTAAEDRARTTVPATAGQRKAEAPKLKPGESRHIVIMTSLIRCGNKLIIMDFQQRQAS